MNANAPINAFVGPAGEDLGPMLYSDPYEKILAIAAMEPEESRSTCTRWWIEELIAAQIRAEERVCGEEPEVIEEYMAWLSEDQLRDLEELETRQQREQNRNARADASKAAAGGQSAGDSSQSEQKDKEAAAAAWMEQADWAMEVWSEVLGVMVDRANGISQEERVRRSEPYADWDGLPPPCLDDTSW
ncbi:hypothetical protein OH77DRAFT_1513771 [Trametes cingulata]|nr:hypothetical protein OH77DRAFT_1513771 [Trametes cingulata]